jgi:hypothetical protein
MSKKCIENNIKWKTDVIKMIPNMNLGQLLYHLQTTKVLGEFKYFDKPLVVDMFEFDCYNHTTGISVTCNILGGEEKLNIIRKTYWKVPGYNHNSFVYLKGAWDKKLEETIQMFREKLITYYTKNVNSLEKQLSLLQESEQNKINSFEEMFK